MTSEESSVDSVAPNEFTIRVGEKVLTEKEVHKLEQLLKTFDSLRNVEVDPIWCKRRNCIIL